MFVTQYCFTRKLVFSRKARFFVQQCLLESRSNGSIFFKKTQNVPFWVKTWNFCPTPAVSFSLGLYKNVDVLPTKLSKTSNLNSLVGKASLETVESGQQSKAFLFATRGHYHKPCCFLQSCEMLCRAKSQGWLFYFHAKNMASLTLVEQFCNFQTFSKQKTIFRGNSGANYCFDFFQKH